MAEKENMQPHLDKVGKLSKRLKDYEKRYNDVLVRERKEGSFIVGIVFGVLLSVAATILDRFMYGDISPTNPLYIQYAITAIVLTAGVMIGGLIAWWAAVRDRRAVEKELVPMGAEINDTLNDMNIATTRLI